MTDFKLFARCFKCRKTKLFIKKRRVKLPIGRTALSREMFCSKCHKEIVTTLENPL